MTTLRRNRGLTPAAAAAAAAAAAVAATAAALTLALLTAPTPAFSAPGDYTGSVLSAAGDIDGDGLADFLIGSPGAQFAEGRVDVYLGRDPAPPFLAATLTPAAMGPQSSTAFGRALAALGDVNGDGYDDVAIGQPLFSAVATNAGRVWIYLGSDTGLVTTTRTWILGTIAQGEFGAAVAGAGDVNGDGFDDLLVGAPYAQREGGGVPAAHGIAYLYYGSANGIVGTDPVTISGTAARQYRGFAVAGVGDFDGDGFADVAIGAPGLANDFVQGRVYLHRGSAAGLEAAPAESLVAGSRSGRFGAALAGVGDLDGDGRAEFAIGSPNDSSGTDTEAGRVYLRPSASPGTVDTLQHGTQDGAHLGAALAGAGDYDGDDRPDILIGEPDFDGGISIDQGRAHLVFGDGDSTRVFNSHVAFAQYGLAVAGAGDTDGDGFDDLLIGVPGTPEGGAWGLVLGHPNGPGPGTATGLVLEPARPNPSSSEVVFTVVAAPDTEASITIHDARGRLVRGLWRGTVPANLEFAVRWDGRDDAGRRTPAGVYFSRLSQGGGAVSRAVVRI